MCVVSVESVQNSRPTFCAPCRLFERRKLDRTKSVPSALHLIQAFTTFDPRPRSAERPELPRGAERHHGRAPERAAGGRGGVARDGRRALHRALQR